MVRIKGVNSDYQYSIEKGKIVEDKSNEVYMKIFICPNDQPSAIDQRDTEDCCEGESNSCPGNKKFGHAAIELHQTKGISLRTDHAELRLEQDGSFVLDNLQQQKARIKFSGNGLEISINDDSNLTSTLTFDQNGNCDIKGKLKEALMELIKTTVDTAIQEHERAKKHG